MMFNRLLLFFGLATIVIGACTMYLPFGDPKITAYLNNTVVLAHKLYLLSYHIAGINTVVVLVNTNGRESRVSTSWFCSIMMVLHSINTIVSNVAWVVVVWASDLPKLFPLFWLFGIVVLIMALLCCLVTVFWWKLFMTNMARKKMLDPN